MCDYAIVDLTAGQAQAAGIQQYYRKTHALEKLLKACNRTRLQDLGRLAAAEYENVQGDNVDYLTSVRRFYHRSSVVSALTPLSLFLKIDPIAAKV